MQTRRVVTTRQPKRPNTQRTEAHHPRGPSWRHSAPPLATTPATAPYLVARGDQDRRVGVVGQEPAGDLVANALVRPRHSHDGLSGGGGHGRGCRGRLRAGGEGRTERQRRARRGGRGRLGQRKGAGSGRSRVGRMRLAKVPTTAEVVLWGSRDTSPSRTPSPLSRPPHRPQRQRPRGTDSRPRACKGRGRGRGGHIPALQRCFIRAPPIDLESCWHFL